MTLRDAVKHAVRAAQKRQEWRYVVWSIEDQDAPGQHYHVATELDMDTFYAGCTALSVVSPEGAVEGGMA